MPTHRKTGHAWPRDGLTPLLAVVFTVGTVPALAAMVLLLAWLPSGG